MLDRTFVDGFTEVYEFLSNFYRREIVHDGVTYPSGEAMFQAEKTVDPVAQRWIIQAPTPAAAKQHGRRVALRGDWDEVERYRAMRLVVAAKFADPDLRELLVGTGTDLLVERNDWHDQTWGCCACPRHQSVPGQNLLGRYLMDHRADLVPELAQQWTRVALTGHRPQGLPAGSEPWLAEELRRIVEKLVAERGMREAISGAAAGGDLLWSEAANAVGVPVWLYQPYSGHDQRWPQDWRDRLTMARQKAERVDTLGNSYSVAVLHARSNWMIRDANAVVAVIDLNRRTGGTWQALQKVPAATPLIHVDVRHRRTTLREPSAS